MCAAATSLTACAGLAVGQSFSEGFESGGIPAGWVTHNQSNPVGVTDWSAQGSGVFAPHSGGYQVAANYNATGVLGTISDWLITPPIAAIANGDTFTFWTRTVTGGLNPDRLQARLSTAGTSVNTGASESDVGDFTTLLLDINAGLLVGGTPPAYPDAYTQESVTITGVNGVAAGRFALRYFVTGAGFNGANSNYIGVDDVSFTKAPPTTCYANCDNSTQVPVLNIADFTCFLTTFAAGNPHVQNQYANCDNSTTDPFLNIADFTCFLTKFAAGCP